MAKKTSSGPSVLAFEKKLVLSDGLMYGTTWGERQTKATPLHLTEKAVRGTVSNRQKDTVAGDPLKLNALIANPNPQRVDACALPMGYDTLKIEFTMKVLSGVEKPSACNNAEFAAKYREVAKNYIEKTGFCELARRYTINLANGRSLWRNRLGSEKIEVVVQEIVDETAKKTWTFNGYEFSLWNFDKTDGVSELADAVAEALSGNRPYLLLQVKIFALVGEGQEVYPSQELIIEKEKGKEKGKKNKVLYQVDGVAAMHSQKIGNAIRSIDTWYPEFAAANVGPIAIEPYGAVTNLGRAFRSPNEKVDFYTLFDKYARGEALDSEDKEHYVMAVLVRGGIFGESDKG